MRGWIPVGVVPHDANTLHNIQSTTKSVVALPLALPSTVVGSRISTPRILVQSENAYLRTRRKLEIGASRLLPFTSAKVASPKDTGRSASAAWTALAPLAAIRALRARTLETRAFCDDFALFNSITSSAREEPWRDTPIPKPLTFVKLGSGILV